MTVLGASIIGAIALAVYTWMIIRAYKHHTANVAANEDEFGRDDYDDESN